MKRISIPLLALVLLAPASGWSDEIPPPHDPRAAHAATDRDHNGEIDREEFEQRIIQIFYFADVDKDGFVTIGQLTVTTAFSKAVVPSERLALRYIKMS